MRRTGRPRTVRIGVAHAVNAQCLENDRRLSLQELIAHAGISLITQLCIIILQEDLHMRKVAAKWMPRALTEQQKWRRCESCIHLEMYQNEGENLLNNIITIDETRGQGL